MTLSAQVLNNSMEFLRRVEMKGLEAFAFVEAYTALQNEHAFVTNPLLAAAVTAQQTLSKPELQPPAPSIDLVDPPAPTPVQDADGNTQVPATDVPLAESTQAVLDAGAAKVEDLSKVPEHVFKQRPLGVAA